MKRIDFPLLKYLQQHHVRTDGEAHRYKNENNSGRSDDRGRCIAVVALAEADLDGLQQVAGLSEHHVAALPIGRSAATGWATC